MLGAVKMTAKVEKRREFLISIMFIAVVLALVYVFFKYLFWIAAPFLLSFFFAILLQKPLRAIDRKTKKKYHTFWSIMLVVLSITVVIVPLGFIISALFAKIVEFVKYVVGLLSDLPSFLATLENELLNFGKFLPDSIYNSYSTTLTNWFSSLLDSSASSSLNFDFSKITSGIGTGVSGVVGVVKNVPSVLIGVVIGIIAWVFFTKDYDYIVRFIQNQLPKGKKNLLVEIKQVFSKTIMKMLRAYALIMAITFCELFAYLSIMKLLGILQTSYILWIAMGIAIFDILPVAGSGGVLIPWALLSLVMGDYKAAIGLLVVYALITVVRQYIEPKIVGDTLGVHPIVTLMGLYFGLKLFGFMGMFIVPITVMTLKAFNDTGRIQIWNTVDRN